MSVEWYLKVRWLSKGWGGGGVQTRVYELNNECIFSQLEEPNTCDGHVSITFDVPRKHT